VIVVRILGIDPGLNVTGYGVIQWLAGRAELVEAGTIQTEKKQFLGQRISTIYRSISEILEEFMPEVLAMEALYSHYDHPRTAIVMGHARGAILLAAAQQEIPCQGYMPTRIKKSVTGNGGASKEQVQRAVQHALALKTAPTPYDVSDALAAALCHGNALCKGLKKGTRYL